MCDIANDKNPENFLSHKLLERKSPFMGGGGGVEEVKIRKDPETESKIPGHGLSV